MLMNNFGTEIQTVIGSDSHVTFTTTKLHRSSLWSGHCIHVHVNIYISYALIQPVQGSLRTLRATENRWLN